MNAPAVNVKTCSQAFIKRSRALDIGSSAEAAIQIITPSATMHNAALIHRSNLNIGLMVMVVELVDLAMSRPVFTGFVGYFARGQVDHR